MEECFVKCDNICVEINSQDDGVKREVLSAFSNKNGKKLMDYFPNKDYDLIKSYANNSLGLDLYKYQAYQPIVIQPFIIKKLLGCSSPISYQAKILLLAKEKNKNVLSLATVADVVNEVEATHFNEKIAVVLDEMAHGSDYYHTYRQNVMNAYVHQDIQSDNLLFKKAKSFTQNDFKVLLDNKNKKWMNKMPGMMQRSSTFFAVNALNLGGKEGVINLLRQAGYTVESIN